jgi:hypothetical protein
MDEYDVENEEISQQHVVLVIRALRLIVLGRTLHEAQQLAAAAISWRRQEQAGRWPQPAAGPTSDQTIEATAVLRDDFRAA